MGRLVPGNDHRKLRYVGVLRFGHLNAPKIELRAISTMVAVAPSWSAMRMGFKPSDKHECFRVSLEPCSRERGWSQAKPGLESRGSVLAGHRRR